MNSDALLKLFSVEFESGVPAYKQIVNQVRAMTGEGVLKEGDKLPTIRSLSEELKLNPNTVAKAYRDLELQGALVGQRGGGSYVAPVAKTAVKSEAKKRSTLDSLYSRLVSEACGLGVSRDELARYLKSKVKGKAHGKA